MSRYLSIHLSRKATSFFFGLWLSKWFSLGMMFLRRTEVDWMYLWDLVMRKGYIKFVLRSNLMKLPVLG
ncbi:hypothetical protein GQ457_12G019170 [Hibiscus cannabinus]